MCCGLELASGSWLFHKRCVGAARVSVTSSDVIFTEIFFSFCACASILRAVQHPRSTFKKGRTMSCRLAWKPNRKRPKVVFRQTRLCGQLCNTANPQGSALYYHCIEHCILSVETGIPTSHKTLQACQRKVVAKPGHTLFEHHDANSWASHRTMRSPQPGKYSCWQLGGFVVEARMVRPPTVLPPAGTFSVLANWPLYSKESSVLRGQSLQNTTTLRQTAAALMCAAVGK